VVGAPPLLDSITSNISSRKAPWTAAFTNACLRPLLPGHFRRRPMEGEEGRCRPARPEAKRRAKRWSIRRERALAVIARTGKSRLQVTLEKKLARCGRAALQGSPGWDPARPRTTGFPRANVSPSRQMLTKLRKLFRVLTQSFRATPPGQNTLYATPGELLLTPGTAKAFQPTLPLSRGGWTTGGGYLVCANPGSGKWKAGGAGTGRR